VNDLGVDLVSKGWYGDTDGVILLHYRQSMLNTHNAYWSCLDFSGNILLNSILC